MWSSSVSIVMSRSVSMMGSLPTVLWPGSIVGDPGTPTVKYQVRVTDQVRRELPTAGDLRCVLVHDAGVEDWTVTERLLNDQVGPIRPPEE